MEVAVGPAPRLPLLRPGRPLRRADAAAGSRPASGWTRPSAISAARRRGRPAAISPFGAALGADAELSRRIAGQGQDRHPAVRRQAWTTVATVGVLYRF
ncbi:MAG: hypothetical protein M0C28_04400 [Candidatus Moduliflexus flocculans]|nr:hypothetical protein [Candidatus Moduliflexus flocculans]